MLRALLLVAVATPLAAQTDLTCPFRGTAEAVRARPSALDSLSFAIGGGEVKVCFGRPNARGRTMIGGDAVPFGRIWRTGANETTKIRSTVPLVIAGIAVPAGTYAIYTVPGETEWQVVVNRAWEQWGHERFYTAEVEAQDVARTTVPVERLADHVETFTIRNERGSNGVTLILEWEHTRIRIPVVAGSSSE
jgi:hypothetical protein